MRSVENPSEFRKNIKAKLNNILKNENISLNLEIGIYNYTIKESSNRKFIRKWNNPQFVQL